MGIELVNGLKVNYRDNSTDIGVIKEVFIEDPYKIYEIPFGSIVIDVGAHIGTFAIRCAGERGCTVYSYEPCEESFNLLAKNVTINNLDEKIKSFKKAVSAESGLKDFNVSTSHYSGSSFYGVISPFYTVKVDCITLEQIFKDHNITHCDVLKIDCEGEEKKILMSSAGVLKLVGKIMLEYHTMQDGKVIMDYLRNNGYSVYPDTLPPCERSMMYAVTRAVDKEFVS